MSFSDDLKAVPTARDFKDVTIALAGKLHTLRFTAVDGLTWANLCDHNPMRPGYTLDLTFGYDLRTLTLEAAPMSGGLLEGDEIVPLQVDPVDPRKPDDPERVDEWRDLLAKVDGSTFKRIGDALWELNELRPLEALAAAKKAPAASKMPSTSRSSSASPRGASSAGNRKKPQSTNTAQTDDSPAQ